MSVFQLHEWWSVKVAEDEEFDQCCFSVGNVDNSSPPSNKIIVGSLQGFLRMYHPTKPNYRIEDLVMEENLNKPILQVAVGRFIPASDTLAVAILHPRELVVYEVLPQAVKDDRVSYYSLRKLYLHDLGLDGKHFTAFNLTFGPFGGVRAKDLILVQSMDGKLQIFEQSAHAFSRQLVDCLIPGPITYLPKLDAFVTVNYAGIAECYRYQVLASSQGDIGESKSESKSENPKMKSVRSSVVEWSVNLGESCRQIIVGNFSSIEAGVESFNSRNSSHASELLFICDKSIFLVKADTGGIIQQKKLDRSDASCACIVPYVAELPNSNTAIAHNFLLGFQDSTLQVYSGFQLTWAAKSTSTPVHLAVATFAGQKGLITAIDDLGYLTVSFLGTKPAIQPILSQVRDLDYDKIDEEHRSLLQIIRDSQSENKTDLQDKILVKSQISRTFDLEGDGPHHDLPLPKNLVPIQAPNSMGGAGGSSRYENTMIKTTVRFYLTYTNEKPATNVSIVINTPPNVFVNPRVSTIPKVNGLKTTPVIVKATFYALKSCLSTTTDISVTVSYLSHKSEPLITTHNIAIPLFVLARPKPPSKNALYKLTLDTDFGAIPLTDLFADILYAYQEAGIDVVELLGSNAIQAMGFQQFNSSIISTAIGPGAPSNASSINPSLVSILVSKNAGRYRVQSDSYSLMYLVLSELEKRLCTKLDPNFANPGNSQQTVSIVKFNENLPLEEYFILISTHLNLRIQLLALTAQLNDVSQQYRLIEKRLLVRFKDRNPTPLHGLDMILKETYDKIILLGDEIETIQKRMKQSLNEIECFSKLLALLISMKFSMTLQERMVLQSYLCPEIKDGIEQGWEETVTASLFYLLKSSVSKGTKDSVSLAANLPDLEMPKTIDNFKKHLLQLIDRLEKGMRLSLPGTTPASVPSNNTNPLPVSNPGK